MYRITMQKIRPDLSIHESLQLIALVLVIFLVAACSGSTDGKTIFNKEGCIGCHTFQGEGGNIGPDLTAVSSRRDAAWMITYIKDPAAVNPDARMPSHSHLSTAKREAVVAYLRQGGQ